MAKRVTFRLTKTAARDSVADGDAGGNSDGCSHTDADGNAQPDADFAAGYGYALTAAVGGCVYGVCAGSWGGGGSEGGFGRI